MGLSRRKEGELRRLLREGEKVEMVWIMNPNDFKDHPDEFAAALYEAKTVGVSSHVTNFIDYSLVPQGRDLSEDEKENYSVGRGEIPLMQFYEQMGTERSFYFKVDQFKGRIRLIVRIPAAAEIFAYLWQQRREKLDEWQRKQRQHEQFDQRGHAAQLIAVNCLLIHIGVRHSLPEAQQLGFVAGLAQEMSIFELCIPRDTWGSVGKSVVARLLEVVKDWPDEGGFARPSIVIRLGQIKKPTPTQETPKHKRNDRRKLNQPERLAFYLTLPGYEGLRYLEGDNPYEYVALIFRDKYGEPTILVLDTANVDNALYILKGDIQKCLEVAMRSKQEIREHPLFAKRLPHQANGSWTTQVEEALQVIAGSQPEAIEPMPALSAVEC